MNSLNIVLAILAIGIAFGVSQQIGSLIAQTIYNRFNRPVTIRLSNDDGSVEEIKLTSEEAKGFNKVYGKMEHNN